MRTALSQIAHIDEILDRIFVHLDTPTLVHRIQLVNKQWNRVAEQHIVYTQKAIQHAAMKGHVNLMKKLLLASSLQKPRVDFRMINYHGLYYSCITDQVEILDLLLSDPRVDINDHYIEHYFETSLMGYASHDGNSKVVKRLLYYVEQNQGITKLREDALTALCFAGMETGGYIDIVDYILDNSQIDIWSMDEKAFESMFRFGSHYSIQKMLAKVDPGIHDNVIIRTLARTSTVEIVDRLLQDPRVDPAAQNNKAIQNACGYGRLDMIERLLLDPRVDPAANNNAAINGAIQYEQHKVVNRLLQDQRVRNTWRRGAQ